MINIIEDIWALIFLTPMPWRFALVVGGVFVAADRLGRWLLPLVLLPEFWLTSQLRHLGLRPLPGTYFMGDIIVFILKNTRRLTRWVLFFVVFGVIIWYSRPTLVDTPVVQYIDRAFTWWLSVEDLIRPHS